MTATFTIPERLWLLAAGLVFAAVLAFGLIHVAPYKHVLPQNEVYATIGLYLSGALLFVGVVLIVDWRRKQRAAVPHNEYGWRVGKVGASNWDLVMPPNRTAEWSQREGCVVDLSEGVPLEGALALGFGPVEGSGMIISDCGVRLQRPLPGWQRQQHEPETELQNHLTEALAVMLRHPQLTVDAGTLKLLSRKPPKVRGPDGRWQKGRA